MSQLARSRAITRSPDHRITRSSDVIPYYLALYSRWGPQNWWPAQSRLEVIVGAYLTQNTNWGNVEKAIVNLREARVLSVSGLRSISLRRLATLVRPSGYFRQKARKLKTFIRFLDKSYSGSLERMFRQPTDKLRAELLSLNGVGPETADSMLLYAGNHPVFVVDAYTRRIFERHQIIHDKVKYEEIRGLVEQALNTAPAESLPSAGNRVDSSHFSPRHPVSGMSRPRSRSDLAQHYNELHALIVRAGNEYCRATQRCDECPLRAFLPPPSEVPSASEGSL